MKKNMQFGESPRFKKAAELGIGAVTIAPKNAMKIQGSPIGT